MRLKTNDGEVFFNPQLVSHVHLSGDQSLLTVHFVNGTAYGISTETHVESTAVAEFLTELTAEKSGFVAVGSEVLNLKSALWIVIPEQGPVQVRSGDNRTRSLDGEDHERVRKLLSE
jgi:hypothetical protein